MLIHPGHGPTLQRSKVCISHRGFDGQGPNDTRPNHQTSPLGWWWAVIWVANDVWCCFFPSKPDNKCCSHYIVSFQQWHLKKKMVEAPSLYKSRSMIFPPFILISVYSLVPSWKLWHNMFEMTKIFRSDLQADLQVIDDLKVRAESRGLAKKECLEDVDARNGWFPRFNSRNIHILTDTTITWLKKVRRDST